MAPYVEIIHPLIDTSGDFPADFGPLRSASQQWWAAPAKADRFTPADDWSVDLNLIPLDEPAPARANGVFWQAGATVLGVIDTPPAPAPHSWSWVGV
jgi:hypothetical protein